MVLAIASWTKKLLKKKVAIITGRKSQLVENRAKELRYYSSISR